MVVARAPRDLRSETPGINSTDNLRRVVKVKARAQHFAKPPQSGGPAKHWIKVKNRSHPAMDRVKEFAA
jgi:hypothetical protein